MIENELKRAQDRTNSLIQELADLKARYNQLESKSAQLTADRLKYVNLCTQLTQENKKLYKKWFNVRRTANKAVLSERLRRCAQKDKSKVEAAEKHGKTAIRRKKSSSPTSSSSSSSSDEKSAKAAAMLTETIASSRQLEARVRQLSDELASMKSRNESLAGVKIELDAKLAALTDENAKLRRESSQAEQKAKSLRSQNEALLEEAKRKEAELREREKSAEKNEEQARDELKKGKPHFKSRSKEVYF